ncbi:sulfatase family protein [Millionella massiliensis]|uniref:sulfatase family protein n=1 Tax=Millionella massiliensis TaxID=1871023 RepID=UPI0023A8BCE9|nr:sulfatase [Millionella massiliensis]
MSRNVFRPATAIALGLASATAGLVPMSAAARNVDASAATRNNPRPKNLVVVMADQWRGEALGILGREPVRTPNLDRFASMGILFSQCVSAYPVSSPARAMFMTGAYPLANGVTANCNSRTAPYGVELRGDIRTWSDVLKEKGYATGYIGKWHLDAPFEPYIDCSNNRGPVAWNEWCPPERRHGFDYWVAYGTYDVHLRPMYWNNATDRDDWSYVDCWGPEYEAGLAVDYIRQHADEPFALMVSMNPPHPGYNQVPERYRELYADLDADSVAARYPGIDPKQAGSMPRVLRDYYACMSGVDEQFGRILNEIERQGLLDNTIVVFTSDHGDMMGVHGLIGKNTFYEEAMRVPLIIGGGGIEHRQDDELLISLEDFTPTILSLLGYGDDIPATVQTRDLSAAVTGRRRVKTDGQLYVKFWANDSTRPGGFDGAQPADGWRGWRTARYTYAVRCVGGEQVDEYLFDRKNDPQQLQNLAATHPRVVQKMRAALRSRLLEIGDPAADNLNDK